MNDASPTRTISLLLVFALSIPLAACSGSGSTPTPLAPGSTPNPTASAGASAMETQIDTLGQATTADQRGRAIEEIVRQGLTLGLLDEAGNQLNPSVPENRLSLTADDVAAHASLIPGAHYRTIDYVVESLAGHGVTLAATDETITLDRFMPDLQAYVDWSFSHRDDPRSTLGLLVGSGHQLRVPPAPPTLDGDTLISPLASSMMAADILLGVDESQQPERDDIASHVASFFVGEVYAGDEQGETPTVKGLLTRIKLHEETLLGLVPSDEARRYARHIWASLEADNRFAVRLIGPGGWGPFGERSDDGILKGIRGTKRIVLNKTGVPEQIAAVITLVPDASIAPVTASFVLSLLSPGQRLGIALFPDADAELTVSPVPIQRAATSVGHDGYRLEIEHDHCLAGIEATRLAGEPRTALLHAAATIDSSLDDLGLKELLALQIAQVSVDELRAVIGQVQPTPWVTAVELQALEGLTCGKEYFTAEAGGGLSFDGCRLNGLPHGTVRHYYETGEPYSECVYDRGKRDGFCTSYWKNPANKPECDASYVDGDMEWERCYYTTGAKWSELDYTSDSGVGTVYHRSGRISSECSYASDGPITCRSYCDNDAGKLCGETKTDESGDVIIEEWDECSKVCQ